MLGQHCPTLERLGRCFCGCPFPSSCLFFFRLFFSTRPSLGLLPVLEPLGGGTDAYTCLALPCGSRAGADLGRTSGSEDDASPVWEREVDADENPSLQIRLSTYWNHRCTILREDLNPPKQSEDCYHTMPLPPSHHGWVSAFFIAVSFLFVYLWLSDFFELQSLPFLVDFDF